MSSWKSASRLLLPLCLGLSCLAAGTAVRAADPGFAQILRERVFDLYQRVNPPPIGVELPVRIVDVDDASLAIHGQWPWPRPLLASLTTTLRDAGAAVIAFDMIFPEPDRASPLQAIEGLNLPMPLASDVRAALENVPTHDQQFASALAASPSVLGVAISAQGQPFAPRAGLALVGPPPDGFLPRVPATIASLDALNQATQGLGGIHVSSLDDDAVVRRIPALTHVQAGEGTTILPSLFVEALRVAQSAQSLLLRTNANPIDPQSGIPQDMRVGAFTFPLTERGAYRIRYGELDRAVTLSANTVLQAAPNPAALASQVGGTLVLVGTSAPGLFDLRATPLGTIVPGVEMHTQALANIISGTHLARPDWTQGLELLIASIAGLLVILAALFLRPLVSAGIAGVAILALGYASWFAFSGHLMLVDATFPIALTLLCFGVVTVPMLVGTDKQQRFIRNAFAHYLAEPVLARLESDPQALSLDGERRTITLLFMDVRGFTSRSEHMEPTEAVDLLNTLLDPLSEAVLHQEGTIDKFMGDGMMAFWNAPLDQSDHAARAVQAGIAMLEAIAAHNANQSTNTDPLAIGVGIHTGEAFVGNMGSKRRFAYSAIGDAVNLAARVEALTAALHMPMLITQETLDAAGATNTALAQKFTQAGDHTVKGRTQPVTVYTLAK